MAWNRKIIHIDMDAFFAAVEERDNPTLQGKPIVVGGDPRGRGVVATANYVARKFGIHSAMPTSRALRLCPKAIFLKPDFKKYSQASKSIMSILGQHTELVEQASLDEAYLDVTHHKLKLKDPVLIAKLIKQNIFAVTSLTASAGVAPNMFLAKIASDFKKPDGLTVVEPGSVEKFLENLSVRKIPGVGPVMEQALLKHNIKKVSDILNYKASFFVEHFGKWGRDLYQKAQGQDERQVVTFWEPKQCSTEETFACDWLDKEWLIKKISEFSKEVFTQLQTSGRMGPTVVLKVKYFDFEQITRSVTMKKLPADWRDIHEAACTLLTQKTQVGVKPIRLLGLGVSGLDKDLEKKKNQNLEPDLFSLKFGF